MKLMLLGLVVFIGSHVFTTMRVARAGAIEKLGEASYKIIYSLIAIAGIWMIGKGFAEWRAAGSPQLWYPPIWTKHLAMPLVLFAAICMPSAYAPTHLRVWLKHPMLVGIKTWATAHLLANGDLAGIVLFGSILAWAVYARISQKRRPAPSYPAPKWQADIGTVIAGLILFALLGYVFHPYVVGVPVLPT
jgi:uncharacterized membrane protein